MKIIDFRSKFNVFQENGWKKSKFSGIQGLLTQVESRVAGGLAAAETSVVKEAVKDLNILEQEFVKDVSGGGCRILRVVYHVLYMVSKKVLCTLMSCQKLSYSPSGFQKCSTQVRYDQNTLFDTGRA